MLRNDGINDGEENLGLFRKDWVLSKNKTTKVNQYFENFTNQDLIFQNGNILKEISNKLKFYTLNNYSSGVKIYSVF